MRFRFIQAEKAAARVLDQAQASEIDPGRLAERDEADL